MPQLRASVEALESRVVLESQSVTAVLPSVNLVNEAGFESGLGSWISTSGSGLTTTSAQAHGGTCAARVANRAQDWYGARQTLQGSFVNGEQLAVALWVKTENAAEASFDIMVRQTDSSGVKFNYVVRDTATNTAWRELRGTLNLQITGTLTSLELWIVGPAAGVNFLLDDVTVGRFNWRTDADARIDQLHKSNASLQFVDQFGASLSSATVEIRQVGQDFAFGSAINGNVLTNSTYADFAARAFNAVNMEFESTWDSNEHVRGVEYYDMVDDIIEWAQANGMRMRGHHLIGNTTGTSWTSTVPTNQLQAEMEQRLVSALAHYVGLFENWDTVNESLNGSYFNSRLGDSIIPWVYERAHAIDPSVKLFTNEYQILEGFKADDYVKHIQWIQAQGGHVDGVGVQAHLPGVVEPFTILSRLDELSTLGLPIWITEFDVSSPNENTRADQLEMFYRLAYSHPDVDAVFMWDFWAGSASRDPNRALMDVDGRINAAGQRLLSLMDEWTTEVSSRPITSTPLTFRGFHGDYEAIITFADGSTSVQTFSLDAAHPTTTVTFTIPTYPKVAVSGTPASYVNLDASYALQLAASNHAGIPQTGSFTYQFDWNNDGVYEQSVNGSTTLSINHAFNSVGEKTFKVRVQDARGAWSDPLERSVAVTGFQLVTDAGNPSLTNLVWSGTLGADAVSFAQAIDGSIVATVTKLNGSSVNSTTTYAGVTGKIIATGLAGDDVMDASAITAASVEFRGGAGNDSIEGSQSGDRLFGDEGDDVILGDGNNSGTRGASDWIEGGAGDDWIEADGSEGGLSAADTIYGGDGSDTIYSDGGEGAADSIFGGDGDDAIYTGGGNDFADGGNGDDILLGGDGGEGASDTLLGGDGRDILIGDGGSSADRGAGADSLRGGAGEDILLAGLYMPSDNESVLAIRDLWAGSGYYIERVLALFGGSAQSGNYLVNLNVNTFNDRSSATPTSTRVADIVYGDADQDWFLVDFSEDTYPGIAADELALDLHWLPMPQ